jgi:hypothetical protein
VYQVSGKLVEAIGRHDVSKLEIVPEAVFPIYLYALRGVNRAMLKGDIAPVVEQMRRSACLAQQLAQQIAPLLLQSTVTGDELPEIAELCATVGSEDLVDFYTKLIRCLQGMAILHNKAADGIGREFIKPKTLKAEFTRDAVRAFLKLGGTSSAGSYFRFAQILADVARLGSLNKRAVQYEYRRQTIKPRKREAGTTKLSTGK